MITKNPMQLKAYIKKKAAEKHISAQLVMQNYMLERLLERISLSPYKHNFIIKGGFLVSAIVGLDTRATMDLDTTIKGFTLTHEAILSIFKDVCAVQIDDDVQFEVLGVADIRETDDYPGIRVSLKANYPPISVPLTVDVTTGDMITPREIEYTFSMLFDDRTISVLAYNLETVLAEKLETVLSRNIANTRPRDYYDIGHKKDADGQDVHGQAHYKGLEPQAEQTADGHAFQLKFQSGYQAVKVDGCFTDDNAGALVDNALGGIEHTHNDIPCVADNEDGKSRLENPAEEHGGVKVVHIVLFGNHLDKLMAHHKGKDSRCNGQHHRFGKTAQHIENSAVPRLRGRADIRSDFAHLGMDLREVQTVSSRMSTISSSCSRSIRGFWVRVSYSMFSKIRSR